LDNVRDGQVLWNRGVREKKGFEGERGNGGGKPGEVTAVH